jgi:hypothetical protein
MIAIKANTRKRNANQAIYMAALNGGLAKVF